MAEKLKGNQKAAKETAAAKEKPTKADETKNEPKLTAAQQKVFDVFGHLNPSERDTYCVKALKTGKVLAKNFATRQDAKKVRDTFNREKPTAHVSRGMDHPAGPTEHDSTWQINIDEVIEPEALVIVRERPQILS